MRSKIMATTVQKTIDTTASNAVLAERIREKLLRRLESEIDNLPDSIGSQSQQAVIDNSYDEKGRRLTKIKEARKEFNLRDLTTAYKNLTADMPKQENAETLDKLDQLLEVAWNASYTETGGIPTELQS